MTFMLKLKAAWLAIAGYSEFECFRICTTTKAKLAISNAQMNPESGKKIILPLFDTNP